MKLKTKSILTSTLKATKLSPKHKCRTLNLSRLLNNREKQNVTSTNEFRTGKKKKHLTQIRTGTSTKFKSAKIKKTVNSNHSKNFNNKLQVEKKNCSPPENPTNYSARKSKIPEHG